MKNAKKLFGIIAIIAVWISIVGCGSTPRASGEPTPFEGEWIIIGPHTQDPNRIVQTKYVFSGNTFILANDGNVSGVFQNLLRGTFTYTPVMIRLVTTHIGTPAGKWIKDRLDMIPTMLYEYEFDNNGNLFFTNETGTHPVVKQ
jgi:hypothetical protein